MVKTIDAIFDGKVLHPQEPMALEPNTRVRITVETVPAGAQTTASFLQTARALNLEGPADWSANMDQYLYGEETQRDD